MTDETRDPRASWHWSRDGAAQGPVDFVELKRLAAAGAITPSSWVHDPVLRKWVVASSVVGLAFVAPPEVAPPEVASPEVASSEVPASEGTDSASVAPPPVPPPPVPPPLVPATVPIDPKVAEVICRASVLVLPFNYLLSPIVVGIVWAIGARDPRVVAECRQTMNCLLSIYIVGAAALVVGFVCAIILIGPFIAAACGLALFVYCVVVGVQGLVAASHGRPYRYPFAWQLLR
ncbi:MAG: DUF4870 domain-containing protein [bacterium]